MMEKWKDCIGWEGLYQVSNYGSVKSCERKKMGSMGVRSYGGVTLKPFYGGRGRGYKTVSMTDGGRRIHARVHVLVLKAFRGMPPKGHESCHNDGNIDNNNLDNLRWDTRKNNHADKKKHGTWQGGENNPFSKLTETDVKEIRQKHGLHTNAEIAKMYGVCKGTIESVLYGVTWKHV